MPSSHSPVQGRGLPGETDADTLDALVDSSRRLGAFWPLLAGGDQSETSPIGPITVPDRTRALVAGMAEYGL
ncbi:hypothetical protein GCM10010442_41230 [Kitasatospora kifunensis]